MGIKEWGQKDTDDKYIFNTRPEVYWNFGKKDFSSYELIRGDIFDHLTFRKAVLDDSSKFLAIHEIEWYVKEDSSLFRGCTPIVSINNTANIDCKDSVLIATNITNFKLTPYKPAPDSTLFEGDFYLYPRTPSSGIKSVDTTADEHWYQNGNRTEIHGFQEPNAPGDHYRYEFYLARPGENCKDLGLELKKNNIYAIEFNMPFSGNTASDIKKKETYYHSTQFQPGKDHLSIGFRDDDIIGNPVGGATDVLFYPPQGNVSNETRHLEFPIKKDTTACVAITFAFYSPLAWQGIYEFSDFKVLRKAGQNFQHPPPEESDYGIGDDDTEDKRNEKKSVKAFELMLEIEHKGEKSGTYSQKEKGMIIATPNNGTIVETE